MDREFRVLRPLTRGASSSTISSGSLSLIQRARPHSPRSTVSNPASGQPGEAFPAPDQQYGPPAQPAVTGQGMPPTQVPYSGQPGTMPTGAVPTQPPSAPAAPGAATSAAAYPAGSYPPAPYQPGAYQPGAYQPGANQPGAGQPGAYQPGVYQPGAGQPGAHQPGAYQPGTDQAGAYQAGTPQAGAYQPGAYQQAPVLPGLAYPPGNAPQPSARRGLARVPWPAWVAGVMVLAAVAMVAVIFATRGSGSDDTAGTGSAAAPGTTAAAAKSAAANANDAGCREIKAQWPNLTTALSQDATQVAGFGLDGDLQQLSALMTDASLKSSGQTKSDMLKVGTDADVMRKDLDPTVVGAPSADVGPFATDVPKLAADCGITLNSDNDPAILGG